MADTTGPKQNWIIGMSGTEWDTVETYRVCGTKDEVKEHLVKLTQKHTSSEDYEYGTEAVDEVQEESNGVLYAYVCFTNSHNDYTATPEMDVIVL